MLSNDILNTIVLGVLLAGAVGLGLFLTQRSQPAELERLKQEETALSLREAEVTDLLEMQAASQAQAAEALRRWNARYKVLPQHLTSPAVVAYLNELSRHGFQNFDVSLGGVTRRAGYSVLTYNVRGTGFFEALYDFIWEVENGRGLYRISDLQLREVAEDQANPVTDVPRRQQMVQFSLRMEAFFGGEVGMSAPDSIVTVPEHVLPPRHLQRNPFYPLVLAQLPPNTDNLVDLETDELVSIVGNSAVFRTSRGRRTVRQGERVYLGRLTSVDPKRARVAAELNVGGIRERLEIELSTGEHFRQALGPVQIVPLTAPRPQRPSPPQPGTPEYRRLFGDGPMSAAPLAEPSAAPADAAAEPGADATDAPEAAATDAPEAEARPEEAAPARPERGVSVRPFPGARPQPDPDSR